MNAWERGSSWRHRLLIGWLALGWIVALLLVFSGASRTNVARAATNTTKRPAPTGTRNPYSPIGLTFDAYQTPIPLNVILAPMDVAPASNVQPPWKKPFLTLHLGVNSTFTLLDAKGKSIDLYDVNGKPIKLIPASKYDVYLYK